LFELADGILQPAVTFFLGRTYPGLGIIFTLLLIFIVGVLTSNAIGKNIVKLGEFVVNRLPVLRQIYSGAKQAMEAIAVPGSFKGDFRKVALVEFPRQGILTLGLVTNEIKDLDGRKFTSVFLPTAPFPWTGVWIMASRDEVFETDISLLEAIEMTLSWGLISPKHLTIKGWGSSSDLA
jgi:uncharacterized membrane protein